MDGILITLIALLFIGTLVMTALVLGFPIPGISSEQNATRSSIRNIVSAQRSGAVGADRVGGQVDRIEVEAPKRPTSSKLTLKKKMKFAQWKIPVSVFYASAAGISLLMLSICMLKFNVIFQFYSLFTGPVFMHWLLTRGVERRFKAFDADYAPFLLSVVSLLKTGMNTMTALEAAAKGLEDGSLLRGEIEMMIERLRYGVPEEKSIGAFAEDVFHPEIELFVQALLLSRRVGGTLSDTLERLAKQVRRRQFFRASALAAVSMQRGSIWFIVFILVGIEAYLMVVYPEAVTGAIADPLGWQIWQGGILSIITGMYWVRQVTKIRV